MNRKTSTGLILGGALIVAAGYGVSASQAAAPPPSAVSSTTMHMGHPMVMGKTVYRASGPVVNIRNYTFHAPATVKKGVTVTVRNKDGVTHTLTNNAGIFGVRVPAHSSRTFRAPAKAGNYRFHCNFHSEMHGVLHVR